MHDSISSVAFCHSDSTAAHQEALWQSGENGELLKGMPSDPASQMLVDSSGRGC